MQVNFGRVIPVKSVTNPSSENRRKRVDNSTFEIAKVLNSESTSTYSKEEAKSIRSFFKEVLGDYNGKDGIVIKRTEAGDLFILSGKDAEHLKNKEKVEGYIEFKAENGKQKKKKDAQIVLSSSQLQIGTTKIPTKVKLDMFEYYKTQRYFTAKVDGFIRKDVEQTLSPTCENRCENVVVDYKGLYL
ncbi:MAG: hypothetical protein IJY61_08650 [Candidatus Gastranaerophilales bacterium]|nr:hypothetical protein [Candidatus Gastranaerophilales bacterium]